MQGYPILLDGENACQVSKSLKISHLWRHTVTEQPEQMEYQGEIER